MSFNYIDICWKIINICWKIINIVNERKIARKVSEKKIAIEKENFQ